MEGILPLTLREISAWTKLQSVAGFFGFHKTKKERGKYKLT